MKYIVKQELKLTRFTIIEAKNNEEAQELLKELDQDGLVGNVSPWTDDWQGIDIVALSDFVEQDPVTELDGLFDETNDFHKAVAERVKEYRE